ncbi:MAG: hypothetical protein PWR29_259 [Methanolobus sp.]|jgi:uncharacterized protein (UPF0333 family)|nr:hypothetical protein [Methanolobus sp.]MDK2834080.1 hypothetical protein [Methanolobus sp.]MDK2911302.1 hypothetical protein [Methanolobus sp.]MDN5308844.1 hypothetical protein [Methanolobus sp.]
MDDKGQITIDYLISITIFLLAIVFVFNYTSGIFTPFQSNSDEVTLIADRVSTNIVEKRISAGDEGLPNLVNATKMNEFFSELNNANYPSTIDSLGMNGSYLRYDLNVTAENISSGNIIYTAGKEIPPQVNVGQTRRIILCRDENTGSTEMMILSFRVW